MLKLENSIKVFVPVKNNNGVKVDFSRELKGAVSVIGGSTTYPFRGNWVEGGKLYNDAMNVVQFNCGGFDNDNVEVLNNLIRAIFTKAEQLAVSVEVNGTLYILESTNDIKDLF